MSKFLDRWELHSAHLLAVLILLTFSAAAAGRRTIWPAGTDLKSEIWLLGHRNTGRQGKRYLSP